MRVYLYVTTIEMGSRSLLLHSVGCCAPGDLLSISLFNSHELFLKRDLDRGCKFYLVLRAITFSGTEDVRGSTTGEENMFGVSGIYNLNR